MTTFALALMAPALSANALGTEALSAEALSLVAVAAALRVFGGLQITDFDVFLFFCHNLALLFWIVNCFSYVSSTEQQLSTPANDILLWDQVIQTDQFFLLALLPSTC
jgi:hypothetical protein